MQQRQSLDLPQAAQVARLGINGRCALAAKLGEYFLLNDCADIPMVFLNRVAIDGVIREGLEYAAKLELLSVDPMATLRKLALPLEAQEMPTTGGVADVMSNLTIAAMSKTMGCILVFERNVLCVVGGQGNYYVMDVANGIFTTVTSPDYDVLDYEREFGNSSCRAIFLQTTSPASKVEEPSIAKKPKETQEEVVVEKKKPKKSIKKPLVEPIVEIKV